MDFAKVLDLTKQYFVTQMAQGFSIEQITNSLKNGPVPTELSGIDPVQAKRAGQIVATNYIRHQATEKSRATSF